MKRTLVAAFVFAIGFPSVALSQAKPIDWDPLAKEPQAALSGYLRIDTSNPPGNEIPAARYLKAILEKEGIEARIVDSAAFEGKHANLYARLKGNGSKK